MRFLVPAVALLAGLAFPQDPQVQGPLVQVPFEKVRLDSPFWARRQETNRTVTIPSLLDKLEQKGYVRNFELAATTARGGHVGGPAADAEVYKVLEAIGHVLATRSATALEARADAIIELIAGAQKKDGYIHTYVTLETPGARWKNCRENRELFCGGHLIEAGLAYSRSTGKKKLLDVAIAFADLVEDTFHEDGVLDPPGHQGIELALVKLRKRTGNDDYLWLADDLLSRRGEREGRELWGQEYQDVLPIRQQFGVSGSALRSLYMFNGMIEEYGATGEYALMASLLNCWRDVTQKRMYVTGGVGNSAATEGFTEPYDLPNGTAFCETAAAVEMARWNRRMLSLTRQAAFADVEEQVLYNALAVGMGLNGKTFFHENPLLSVGGLERKPWHEDPRGATQLARFLPTVAEGMYAHDEDEIYVCHYAAGEAELQMGAGKVRLIQETDYPWDGKIKLTVVPEKPMKLMIHTRVPIWCPETFTAGIDDAISDIKLNRGDDPGTWTAWERTWTRDTVLTLEFPMTPERVYADERVAANSGRVALRRGPLVFALEGVDNGNYARHVYLPRESPLADRWEEKLFGGTMAILADGYSVFEQDNQRKVRDHDLYAIPYHLWGNRGPNELVVWIPEGKELAELPGESQRVIREDVTMRASHCYRGDSLAAIADGALPKSSADLNVSRMTFRDHVGSKEWLQYTFDRERLIDTVKVYWADDVSVGGTCRTPRKWKLYWLREGEWLPCRPAEGSFFWNTPNTHNEVKFEAVRTTSLRLELELREGYSAGCYEWEVIDVP